VRPAGRTHFEDWGKSLCVLTTQEAMMDGEDGTTKYAKGAKREAKLQSSTFAVFAYFVI